jgi:hypothetical protein
VDFLEFLLFNQHLTISFELLKDLVETIQSKMSQAFQHNLLHFMNSILLGTFEAINI